MADRRNKRPVQVNWNFGEETEDEIRLSAQERPSLPGRASARRIWVILFLVVAIITAGIVALNISAQRAREAERLAIQSALQERVELEAWAWQNAAWTTLAGLLDPDARREWARWHTQHSEGLHHWAQIYAQRPVVRVESVERMDPDLAQVQVRFVQAEVPDAIQRVETRFYRLVGDSWMRTAPERERWGDATVLGTTSFDFEYPVADAAHVDAVATVSDGVLDDLRLRLGTDPSNASGRFTVQIVPDNFAANVDKFVGRRLVLLTPKLTRVPATWDGAQALSVALIDPLSRYAVDEAVAPDQIHPSWHVMVQGVAGWLAQAVNPLVDAASGRSSGPLDLYVRQNGPPSLESLHVARDPNWTWASGWMTLAAESVVAYGLETYGADKVDDLVAGFVVYDTWEALLPDVFGVTAPEFEAGWQAWLMQ
jgi:hypothetical protein